MLWERKRKGDQRKMEMGRDHTNSGVIRVALIKELTPEQRLGAKETE